MSEEKQESRSRQGEEFHGKTVEAAVSAGLAALQLSRDQVEIDVIKQGSRGVLGIGAEDAVVRLSVLSPLGAHGVAEPAPVPKPKSQAEPSQVPALPESAKQPSTKTNKPGEAAEGARRQRAPKASPERPPRAEAAAAAPPAEAVAGTGEDKSAAAILRGKELLQGLVDRMNVRARVEIVQQSEAEADEDDRVPVLNIVGEDLGVLIGRQNEVLNALELITRMMVNQSVHVRSEFIVDVNGYRARRAESLRKLALRMADQVVETGRTAALEPMPPAERRIIHLALRDHPEVTTQSVGEGDRRKVTIVPRRD
jgi:spoIIIJ-associated protein